MKTRNISLLALSALLTISCHSWDDPAEGAGMDSYGNKYIQATNPKTIAEIKSLCQKEIDGNSLKKITQSMQIQGVIIGDDEGSNLYKQLYIKDGTGALCLSINKSGLYTTAGVGQCIMVELQGLYVGGYGKQGQIGVSYIDPTKEGATPQIGRMSRNEWEEHYKLIPTIDGLDVAPIPVKSLDNLDIAKDCGKLVKLCGIKMKDADGKAVFAPSDGSVKLVGGCVNRDIEGSSSTVVRTSTYAKFASMVMPTEKINITGIAARYNDTWQIMIRTLKDIEPYKGDEKTIDDYEEAAPAGSGTVADPYNVAAALEKASLLPKIENASDANASNSMVDVVVKGYVKTISIDTSYGNATYYICDNAEGLGKALEIYRGASVGGAKFKQEDEVKKGDLVVVQGTIVNFKGTLEFTTGSKILSLNGEGDSSGGDEPTPPAGNVEKNVDGAVLTLTNTSVTASTNTVSVDFSTKGWANASVPPTVTLEDGTTIAFAQGDGSNGPKYYTSGTSVRLYAKNSIIITGSSKPIAKAVLTCEDNTRVGNDMLYGSASGNALTIVNDWTSSSAGTQLRVKTIVITYAQ